jgi:hypothetical protein
MPNKPMFLLVQVPKLGGIECFARFPLEHLKPPWRVGLTNLKYKEELASKGMAPVDEGQHEPFDVFLCQPAIRSEIVRADPRELQDAFFGLKETSDLLSFLNRTGMWRESYSPSGAGWCPKSISDLEESPIGKPLFVEKLFGKDEPKAMAITPEAIWHEQTLLREATVAGSKSWKRWFATSHQQMTLEPVPTNPFYRYTARCTGDAIEALIAFDLLQGSKFSLCKRTDCSKPFVANRRGKQFCSYNCAHVMAVRKSRKRKARKQKGS